MDCIDQGGFLPLIGIATTSIHAQRWKTDHGEELPVLPAKMILPSAVTNTFLGTQRRAKDWF